MLPYSQEEWLTNLTWIIEEIENKKLTIIRLIFGDPLFTPIEKECIQELIVFLSNHYPIAFQQQIQTHYLQTCVVGINMTNNRKRISAIDKKISVAEQACIKKSLPQNEIEFIQGRYNRLISRNYILTKLLGKQRNKRGLANFVGDISKTFVDMVLTVL